MNSSTEWQLERGEAERYQTILTPTILGPFAKALVAFAQLLPGEKVVDVGCGTGAAARYAAAEVGQTGFVMGVDVNPGMIDVARSLPVPDGATVEWRVASATNLPVSDEEIEVAVCAQTLQFLPEKRNSLAEIYRVLCPGGRAVFSLWCPIEENPYFYTLVAKIGRHIGDDVAAGLKSAFALTDFDTIRRLLNKAGFRKIDHVVSDLILPLPDLISFVPQHIGATPMAAGFSRATAIARQTVVLDIKERLDDYVNKNGGQMPFRSHMIRGQKLK